jgi:purine-binding chemotaxis protein CheW
MTGAVGKFLLCRIGSRIGALAVRHVRETMRPLPIEPLAAMPPFLLGLAIVRGSPAPVIDAGRLLGLIGAPAAARFVSLRLGDRTAALAVDEVLDVCPLPREVAAVPPLLREAAADLVSTIGALDTELLLVLEAARLVPESIWSAVATSSSGAFE